MAHFNVTIVNPPVFKVVEPYYDLPNFPRTALAFLAGYIRENSNVFDITVIDAKFDKLNFEQTKNLVMSSTPKVLGLTAMTNEIKAAAYLAELIKHERPDLIIVIGGVHATALPEETLREFPQFDYLIKGEGESAFLDLLYQLKENQPIDTQGVCYLKDDHFIDTGQAPTLPDQDALKPAWDLFRPAAEYMIQSSRGCPFSCNFCMNPGGRIVRPRTVQTTLDEIGWLIENKKPKSIYFGDEIFTVKKQRAIEICQGLIERGYHKRISWWCQTHVNTLDEELIKIMKESNCSTVGLGIETGDTATLKQMGKGTSKEKILKAIQLAKKHELSFNTFFILGQPNETIKSALNTINFAVELNPTIPIFGLMVPYPGTQIWTKATNGESGYKLLSKNWDHYNKQIGNALELEGITRRQLEILQIWGYLKVFLFNFRFWDLTRFVFRFRKEGIQLIKTQSSHLLERLGVQLKQREF